MGNELLTGFLAGQGDSNNRDGGFFGNEGLWAKVGLQLRLPFISSNRCKLNVKCF